MQKRETSPRPAALLRRLAAIFYDCLILFFAVYIPSSIAVVAIRHKGLEPGNHLWQIYLVLITFFYFAAFWTYGGQTLGMKAWHLRLRRLDGGAVTLWQALLRFLVVMAPVLLAGAIYSLPDGGTPQTVLADACFAVVVLSFLWSLVDRRKRTWHDRISETDLIFEKPLKAGKAPSANPRGEEQPRAQEH